jgi:peptide chain release factor 1
MFKELEEIVKEYQNLNQQLSKPEIIANQEQFQKLAKRHSEIARMAQLYIEYKKIEEEILENEQLRKEEKDPELREMIDEEIDLLEKRKDKISESLQELR